MIRLTFLSIIAQLLVSAAHADTTALDALLKLGTQGQPRNVLKLDDQDLMVQRVAERAGIVAGYNTRITEINGELQQQSASLSSVYNFSSHLIKTNGGALVFPPIVAEYLQAGNSFSIKGPKPSQPSTHYHYRKMTDKGRFGKGLSEQALKLV